MKVAIIGAGRNKNGIGRYIGKYFQSNGAEVIAVVGPAEQSSRHAAAALQQYGIHAAAYADFASMAAGAQPDAVVIASPHATHGGYVAQSIDSGVHIFCEKPFLWPLDGDGRRQLQDVFKRAEHSRVTVAMNSQWPFALKQYEALCGPLAGLAKKKYFMSMRPASAGLDMIPDAVPHALSILRAVFGRGTIAHLEYAVIEQGMHISFQYCSDRHCCEALVELISQQTQPRDFMFGFDDKIVRRIVNMADYSLRFSYGQHSVGIPDPLDLSVRDFIEAVARQQKPAIGREHIIDTSIQLKQIYDTCDIR